MQKGTRARRTRLQQCKEQPAKSKTCEERVTEFCAAVFKQIKRRRSNTDTPPPRTKAKSKRVRKKKRKETTLRCCVCHHGFINTTKTLARISCGHIFCPGCIGTWVETSATCPLCRAPFVEIILGHRSKWLSKQGHYLDETSPTTVLLSKDRPRHRYAQIHTRLLTHNMHVSYHEYIP